VIESTSRLIALIILGVVLLVLGIVLGHFFPNRYWIALIALGIVLMIIGVIFLLLPSVGSLDVDMILPRALSN